MYKLKKETIKRWGVYTCEVCSSKFIPRARNQRFCSMSYYRSSINKPNVTYYKRCPDCSKWFTTSYRLTKYCGDPCYKVGRANITTSLDYKREYYLEKYDFVCQICRGKFIPANLHCHHIIPLFLGGSDLESNITVLCVKCHQRQHTKSNWNRIKDDIRSAKLIAKGQLPLLKEENGVYVVK